MVVLSYRAIIRYVIYSGIIPGIQRSYYVMAERLS